MNTENAGGGFIARAGGHGRRRVYRSALCSITAAHSMRRSSWVQTPRWRQSAVVDTAALPGWRYRISFAASVGAVLLCFHWLGAGVALREPGCIFCTGALRDPGARLIAAVL
jgi:hypothetical protein